MSKPKKFELKQWQLTMGIILGLVILIFVLIGVLFGINPLKVLEVAGKSFVYLLFVLFVFVFPVALGILAKTYLFPLVDDLAELYEKFGWLSQLVMIILLSLVLGGVEIIFVNWVVAAPILSSWPWEWLRWPAAYETYPWWVGIYSFIVCLIAFGGTAMFTSD